MLKTSARQLGFGVLGAALVITVMSGPLVYAADPTDTDTAPMMLAAPVPVMSAVQDSSTSGATVLGDPAIGSLSDMNGISGYIGAQAGDNVNQWLASKGVDPDTTGDITDATIPDGAKDQVTSSVNDDGTGTLSLGADATGTQVGFLVGDAQGQTGMTWNVNNVVPTAGHENDQLDLGGADLLKWWNGTTWYADVNIMDAATGLFTCKWTTDGMSCDGTLVQGGTEKTAVAVQSQAQSAADNMNQNINADTTSTVPLTQMLTGASNLSLQVSSPIPYSFAMNVGDALTAGNSLTVNPSDVVSGSWLNDFTFNQESSGALSDMAMTEVLPPDVLVSLPELSGYSDLAQGQSVADMGSLALSQAAANGQFDDSSAQAVISSTNDQIDSINKAMADSETASNGYEVVFRPLDQDSQDVITQNTHDMVSSLMAGGWSQTIANSVTADVTVDSTIDAGKITDLTPTGVTYDPSANLPDVGVDGPPAGNAPPPQGSIFTQPQDGGYYGTTQVTQIQGTAEAGSTVTVTLPDNSTACTATTDDAGAWSCDYALTQVGPGTLDASVTDSGGNPIDAGSVSYTVVDVPTPTIDVANGQTISGTADPATAVVVIDLAGNVLGQMLVNADGTWAITTPADAQPGMIAAAAMTQDGAVSAPAIMQLVMDGPQAPTADLSADNTLTGTLPGTIADGTQIVVTYPTVDGTNTVSVDPAADGTWTAQLPDDCVPGQVTVVAKDAAGNVSGAAKVTVKGSAPDPDAPNPPAATDASPTGSDSTTAATDTDTSGSDSTTGSTDSSTPGPDSPPATTPDTQSTPAGTPGTQSTPAGTPGTQSTPASTPGTQSTPASTPGTQSTPAGTPGTQSTPAGTPGTQSTPTGVASTPTVIAPAPSTQTSTNPSSAPTTPGVTTPTALPSDSTPTENATIKNPTVDVTDKTPPATGPSGTPSATDTTTGAADVYYVVQTSVDGQAANGGVDVVTFAAGRSQTDPVSGVRADFTADAPGMMAQSYCVTDATGTCTVGVVSPTAGPVDVHAFVNGVEVDNDLGLYTSPVTVTFVDAAPEAPSAKPMGESGPMVIMNVPVVVPGTVVTLSGANWSPGETIVITIQSTPITLPPLTANADGTITAVQVPVPADLELGTHTLTAVGSVSGAYETTFTVASSASGMSIVTGGSVAGGSGIAWVFGLMAVGFGAFMLVSRRHKA